MANRQTELDRIGKECAAWAAKEQLPKEVLATKYPEKELYTKVHGFIKDPKELMYGLNHAAFLGFLDKARQLAHSYSMPSVILVRRVWWNKVGLYYRATGRTRTSPG